ncbi:hypothetical protein RHGRI_002276 [Rhododendron griersonianum]|uniref:Uncharacterized protein n=1 Tax=Rhododendron griersonianum TaxID=479676 RepID=A0AAV6LRM7_9ERIC|nr:hypothetical protein RHGRI_002276 [Rhododendron griersonianum]
MNNSSWQHRELICLILYALVFYVIVIRRSLHLSHDHYGTLYGLRPGWIGGWYNCLDVNRSDAMKWFGRTFFGFVAPICCLDNIMTLLAA